MSTLISLIKFLFKEKILDDSINFSLFVIGSLFVLGQGTPSHHLFIQFSKFCC